MYISISGIPANKEVKSVCFIHRINRRILIMPDKMQFFASLHKKSVKSSNNTRTLLWVESFQCEISKHILTYVVKAECQVDCIISCS